MTATPQAAAPARQATAPATQPDIRFCTKNDIALVEAFLDAHWAKGHVLAHDRTLMDWQHRDVACDRYSYVVASRPGVTELDAILGFISTRQYDASLSRNNAIWLTTWMVNPEIKAGGLGMRVARFVQQHEPHTMIGTVGNNAAVEPVYKALGYTTGLLDRYVITNPAMQKFHLLQGHATLTHQTAGSPSASIRMLSAAQLDTPEVTNLLAHTAAPAKTPAYLAARYLQHPRYTYQLMGVEQSERLVAVAVTRLCTAPVNDGTTATALRVVDWFGPDNALAATGSALSAHLAETGIEYADLYVHGIEAKAFASTLWNRVETDGPLIVPNYFEPFTASNTEIRFAVKQHGEQRAPLRLFKADADQDRPNTPPRQENGTS